MTKPKKEPEYTLNVFRRQNERTGKTLVVFLVQTTKIFVSFRYEILLEEEVEETTIHLRIVGLHAPALLMPAMGPAIGVREHDGLHGTYALVVTKQDRTENHFQLEIGNDHIRFTRQPRNAFILVSTEPVAID